MRKVSEQMRVVDLMNSDVVSCPGDASLAAVATTISRRRAHALFVLDDSGRPSGVVSDFDLLAGEWLGTDADSLRAMREVTAAELMTAPVETILVSASAAEAATRMQALRIGRLLVTDESGSAVGVISVSDLVAPFGRPSGERRSVRDVMSYAIVTCLPDASPEAIARAMTERKSRSVVVIDEKGRAVGVITGADMLSLYEPAERMQTAADLMSQPVITADPDLPLAAAADLMITREIHRLVVVDRSEVAGAPLGIVSTSDIVAEMAQEQSVWQRTER
jgi:CBS domain-containing protein